MTKPLDPGIKTPSTALLDITNFSIDSRKIKKKRRKVNGSPYPTPLFTKIRLTRRVLLFTGKYSLIKPFKITAVSDCFNKVQKAFIPFSKNL